LGYLPQHRYRYRDTFASTIDVKKGKQKSSHGADESVFEFGATV